MRYIATAWEHGWSDQPVLEVRIPADLREEWSSLNPEFWWSFAPAPSLWDRLTRTARSRTFGRALGALLVCAAFLVVLGFAGWVEGL